MMVHKVLKELLVLKDLGVDGDKGVTGLAGNSSLWKFIREPNAGNGPVPNPASGEISWLNNLPNPWESSSLYVHKIDLYGNDMSEWLESMKAGDILYIRNYEFFKILLIILFQGHLGLEYWVQTFI